MDTKNNDQAIQVAGLGSGSTAIPSILSANTTISPIFTKNKLTGYELTMLNDQGVELRKFQLSVQKGSEYIEAALARLTAQESHNEGLQIEVDESILPTAVANAYIQKLRSMGIPEDQLPKSTLEMIERAKGELQAYWELGQHQLKGDLQKAQGLFLDIFSQVASGNRVVYNNLPDSFKKGVDSMVQPLAAYFLHELGVTEETTVESQRQMLKINLMAREETVATLAKQLGVIGEQLTESLTGFLGGMLGGTYGSIKSSYDKALNKNNK